MKKLLFFILLVSVITQFGCADKNNTNNMTSKDNAEKMSISTSHTDDEEQLNSNITDENDDGFNQEFHYESISGNYQDGKQETKIIESEEDMNYLLEKLNIIFSENIVTVQTEISGEKIESNLKVYPSQIGDDEKQSNKILGVEQKNDTNSYSILKFTIDKESDEESLLIPNQKWKGKTVLSLAYYHNNDSKEKYYFQIPLDDLDYDKLYQIAKENLKNDTKMREEIMDIELAYFSMEPFEEFSERIENESSLESSDKNRESTEEK